MRALAMAVSLLLVLPAAARAQGDESDPRREQARRLMAQGEREFDARAFLAAERTFARVRQLMTEMGSPRAFMVRYNEGRAAEEAGVYARAADSYQRWLDEGGRNEANASEVEARIRDLRERASLTVGAGGISPIGPIVIGVGGAAIVVGLILGGVALSEDGDLSAACPDPTACDPALADRQHQMRLMAGASDVLWVSGAAIAAVGLVLTLTLSEGASNPSIRATPGGAYVRGTF